jgi:hypothetical protein
VTIEADDALIDLVRQSGAVTGLFKKGLVTRSRGQGDSHQEMHMSILSSRVTAGPTSG